MEKEIAYIPQTKVVTFQDYKTAYHALPKKYKKHGDMPTVYEMYDDVDAYIQEQLKKK